MLSRRSIQIVLVVDFVFILAESAYILLSYFYLFTIADCITGDKFQGIEPEEGDDDHHYCDVQKVGVGIGGGVGVVSYQIRECNQLS